MGQAIFLYAVVAMFSTFILVVGGVHIYLNLSDLRARPAAKGSHRSATEGAAPHG